MLTLIFICACSSMMSVLSHSKFPLQIIYIYEHEASLPVRLRIYQLSDLNQFKEATFRELWKMDQKILGDSLVSMKELTVTPGLKNKLNNR